MTRAGNEASTRVFANDSSYEGRLIDILYEMEEGPVRDFFIDITRSGEEATDVDERTQRTADRIDVLCETLGVPATESWPAVLAEGVDVTYARRMARRGMTLGKFITNLAMDRLPIEDNPDDDMVESEITLHVEGEYLLRINIGGHIWKNYYFEDTELISTEEMAEEDIMNHPDSISRLEWENTYTADVLPLNTSESTT
jgi:hypothetical protein